MVTFPPCLVTFPRCLIPKTCASHGCTLISLKCLISGDIAMQHVEKHFIAVEVNAAHFFPILVKRSIRRFTLIRTLYNNNSWSLASLYCSFTNHFFQLLGFVGFLCKQIARQFSTNFNLNFTPQAILMSSCEDETSLWWSFSFRYIAPAV